MEELEVFFCDLCNTSVPESALEDGTALRHHGKVIGPCCLPAIRPMPAGRRATAESPAQPRSGILTAAFVILVAVAGTAVFLDWRVTEETRNLNRALSDVQGIIERQEEQIAQLEKRLARTLRPEDLRDVETKLAAVGQGIATGEATIKTSLAETGSRVGDVKELLKTVRESQITETARLGMLHDEIRGLSRDIAEVKAAPRAAPEPPPRGSGDTIEPAEASEMGGDGLPPEIGHNITRLSDADDGTRFEAVDELLQTKDNRIYQHLLPLAKDPDPFVRRLVLEGLGVYRSAEAVEALLTALADPEGIVRHTAYMSLTKVTGQTLQFDPDASADQRTAMQRRWRQWWEKNKKDF